MKIKTKNILFSFLALSFFAVIFFSHRLIVNSMNVFLIVKENLSTSVKWAIPELRVETDGPNRDTNFYLTLRNPSTHQVVFTQPGLLSTNNEGEYPGSISLDGASQGTYDIGFKSTAHLTKVLRGINLFDGNYVLNFTQPDNISAMGPLRLVAGDIDGTATSPSTSGDDTINAVDLSVMLATFDADDPTGNGIRANLNQDQVVNSVDLSVLLNNLDKEGEK